jgi:hypothetical protein
VSLGVVTGQPTDRQRKAIETVRSRYQMISMIQVGGRSGRPRSHIGGVFTLDVRTSGDFARSWNVAAAS